MGQASPRRWGWLCLQQAGAEQFSSAQGKLAALKAAVSSCYKWTSALIYRDNVLTKGFFIISFWPCRDGASHGLCWDASASLHAPFGSAAVTWQQPLGLVEELGA